MRTRGKPSAEERHVVTVVSENVRRLMSAMDWSEHDLAKRSGVSQKAINNLLNRTTGCTVTTAEKLGRPFGLTAWQLMVENISPDDVLASTLTEVVTKIVKADPAGRAFILSAAKRA